MASKNQTLPQNQPSVDEDLPKEEPEEFETDLPDYEPDNTTTSTMSWEELNDLTVDNSTDEEEWQKLNPPMRVDYIKEDKWEFNREPTGAQRSDIFISRNDSQPGDISPEGRLYLNFRGYCKPLLHQGHVYNPRFTMRISPDKREREMANGDIMPDPSYKLYLDVANAYLAFHGETLDKRRKGFLDRLVNFVVNDSFKINHFNGDNGPQVSKVKPVYKRR